MATMRCKCGTVLRDDDPSFSYLALSRREFDVEEESTGLLGRATEVWRCPVCDRLWIFWTRADDPTEYVPWDLS